MAEIKQIQLAGTTYDIADDTKVKKTGDTMTGSLTVTGTGSKSTTIESNKITTSSVQSGYYTIKNTGGLSTNIQISHAGSNATGNTVYLEMNFSGYNLGTGNNFGGIDMKNVHNISGLTTPTGSYTTLDSYAATKYYVDQKVSSVTSLTATVSEGTLILQ